MSNNEYALDRIANELDHWYSNLEYYMTAWGGDCDPENVAICEAKIKELNEAIEHSGRKPPTMGE
jgi:hypothetical protein